ncbi:MAG: hypothetical protein H7Y42_15945 [Chitinophagaceae bacterium]|nr:hypothetical protein [Chitinophagaceae bacterium]
MKKLLFSAVLLFPLIAISQKKVDLDKYRFSSQFRSLPSARLDTSYRTYHVRVETSRLMQSYLNDMTPESAVQLDGWRMLTSNGHIGIQVKLEDLLPESVSTREREEIIKDRNGKETGRRRLYSQEVVYTFSAFADISDYKGAHIDNIILANRSYKQTYRSPEFAIRQLAEGYFMINSFAVTEQLFKSCVNRAMNFLSAQVTEYYGYGERTVTDHMWIIDSKKHPEYRAHRQAFLQINEALFSISANRTLDGVKEQLQPAIDYFESIKRKYTSTSKHDRKIRYASYYNLAKLYYYLDDPQAMKKEASGLILNDFDASDGRALESSALYLKNLFMETGFNSRHFPINISTFKGPRENAVVLSK